MAAAFTAHGKQVLHPSGSHYADATDEAAAAAIAAALNRPVTLRDRPKLGLKHG